MSRTVITRFGPGQIVDESTSRGVLSYHVEGSGFSIWASTDELQFVADQNVVDDTEWGEDNSDLINTDNSTLLPYDPSVQNPSSLFSDTSTIAPGEFEFDKDEFLEPTQSLDVLQAALGPKYARVDALSRNRYSEFHARLFNDPVTIIREIKSSRLEQTPPRRLNAYFDLLERNASLREAAWKDVRAKAVRLRNAGQVQIEANDNQVILATVMGDNDIYDTIVVRGNHPKTRKVSEWTCSCPWGYYAWRRHDRYFGRMCSHAYAAYMQMQSSADGAIPVYSNRREAETKLRTKPESLNIEENPTITWEESHDFWEDDVEDDDRDEVKPAAYKSTHGGDFDREKDYLKTANFWDDLEPHEPFSGSGPREDLEFTTSEDYVKEHEMDDWEDLNDMGEATNPGQRNAHLRVAGRQYTFAEQQALIDERAPGGALPFDDLDLNGTHYLM